MKKFLLSLCMAVALLSCSQEVKVLTVDVPSRPAGQEDVIALTTEPLDTVRVGIIGIGMRGIGAVYRFTHIPGVEVAALCDLRQECIDRGQERLGRAGKPVAAEYCGPDAWKELCERGDIDLVYVVTDWENHAKMGVYAMECGKHVAIEVPAAMTLDEIWQLVNTSDYRTCDGGESHRRKM